MPQMAPLSWLSLMLSFTVILLMFNIKTFYTVNHQPLFHKKTTTKPQTSWKW
uniref:ATP synthase complex subunit 8 n=1 Tax=Morphostenophanes yunnanus TaxID=2823840 RepID=A0A8F3HTE9_9CUCU|nr:ATP synthase F0 subunit 8 [Morphostenophanes yunnanus]